MNIDRIVFLFAGAVVLAASILAYVANPLWLLLSGFVGLNLMQASVTGFCPMAMVLKKLGKKAGPAFE
jgi:hypothetical protein